MDGHGGEEETTDKRAVAEPPGKMDRGLAQLVVEVRVGAEADESIDEVEVVDDDGVVQGRVPVHAVLNGEVGLERRDHVANAVAQVAKTILVIVVIRDQLAGVPFEGFDERRLIVGVALVNVGAKGG